MTKQIRIEKRTVLDGYQYGKLEAITPPSDYINDGHRYIMDKAINQIQNHQNYPADYPNPPAGLAYCFGAYVEPVLKTITRRTGNAELEKNTRDWFLQCWLPKAESALMTAPPISLRYGKNRKVPDIFKGLICDFEVCLDVINHSRA